jgi:hypothetical protein
MTHTPEDFLSLNGSCAILVSGYAQSCAGVLCSELVRVRVRNGLSPPCPTMFNALLWVHADRSQPAIVLLPALEEEFKGLRINGHNEGEPLKYPLAA